MTTMINITENLNKRYHIPASRQNEISNADRFSKPWKEFEDALYRALETYSNVHRGSGHFSQVSTHLYERAREVVMDYLNLNKKSYTTIFTSPARTEKLINQLDQGSYTIITSQEAGIPLGINALVVKNNALPKGTPIEPGGGTTRMIGKDWAVWSSAPDKFEAGTPAVINAIGLAKALLLIRKYGKDAFKNPPVSPSAREILYQDSLSEYSGAALLNRLREKVVHDKKGVPTSQGKLSYINLDNSASTPTFEPIWEAFINTLHQPKEMQDNIIKEVRKVAAGMLQAPVEKYELIFTSNTTEAINLAAQNLKQQHETDSESVVLNTLLEHSSNDLPWRKATKDSIIRLPVDEKGFFSLDVLERTLSAYNQQTLHGKKRIKLVAVSGASNVLGSCNDLSSISRIAHKYDARILVDAAQLIAHKSVDIAGWDIDYLAFSAHKVYAPFGSGMLIAKKEVLNFSNTEMEKIYASGHSNPAGIAALGKALILLQRIGMDVIQSEEQALTKQLLEGMKKISGITVYGVQSPDDSCFSEKVGVVSFNLPGMMADRTANRLVRQGGIGVRFGCHCAHLIVKDVLGVKSGLEKFQRLIALLFHSVQFPGMARVSLGLQNTAEDIEKFLETLKLISKKDNKFTNTKNTIPIAEVKNQIQDFVKNNSMMVYE
ncbi:MAG: aminotransferase class V-fold PLP-dependent enzyme [Bacteroidota bacterium]